MRRAMVGTDELRQLLTATTAAGTKTVLVGDAHQLAPVKARGGMFAQLCQTCRGLNTFPRYGGCATQTNAPHRSRCATAALRRSAGLSTGTAPMTDCTAGTRSRWPTTRWTPTALTPQPVGTRCWCATPPKWPMLSTSGSTTRRVTWHAPTVTGAGGQRIGVGDLILSRRNDPTISVRDAADQCAVGGVGAKREPVAGRWDRPGDQSRCRRTPRRRCPRRLRRRLFARAHQPRVRGHRALRPGRDRRHQPRRARREHQPRTALRRHDPRPRSPTPPTSTNATPAITNTAIKNPMAPTSSPVATATPPPASCVVSSPTTTKQPSPPSSTPHRPQTESCPIAYGACSTDGPPAPTAESLNYQAWPAQTRDFERSVDQARERATNMRRTFDHGLEL